MLLFCEMNIKFDNLVYLLLSTITFQTNYLVFNHDFGDHLHMLLKKLISNQKHQLNNSNTM